MTTTTPSMTHIDELMEKASAALTAGEYFSAERMANKALRMAWKKKSYDMMTRIIMPLQEARRQRTQQAIDNADGVWIIDEQPITEEFELESGCYLIQPPAVGADARQLRILGLQREVPVAVLCREPTTQLRQIPIVAVGNGVTIRFRFDPPESGHDDDDLDLVWFASAMEALGDAAIDMIDPTMEVHRRAGFVLDYLDAVPEHEKLHQALITVCEEAHESQLAKAAKKK